uniref:B-cell receptor CD22 n=1 Tax=Maylandia zebra TaxID=106582 RepID=A0A3P9DBY6_9CICH
LVYIIYLLIDLHLYSDLCLKGSTVDIRCTYTYPSRLNGNVTVVEKAVWFTKMKGDEFVDVRTEAEFAGRVQYHCDNKDCTLRITDLRESDSAEYKFRFVTNQPGGKYTGSPGVTLSMLLHLHVYFKSHPSGEIVEGSSVTLTCRTHANPAANNTLYKGNQILPLTPEGIYNFASISSEDRGIYDCKTEDQLSVSLFIDVQYAPKIPSVSVSPSGELVEGSSVTLTCSSDANPAANYTWYKEDDNSAKASGQNFIITDFRPEHSGSYYCEAQNTRGPTTQTLVYFLLARGALESLSKQLELLCVHLTLLLTTEVTHNSVNHVTVLYACLCVCVLQENDSMFLYLLLNVQRCLLSALCLWLD